MEVGLYNGYITPMKTRWLTNIAGMGDGPMEDVFPTLNGDFPGCHVSFPESKPFHRQVATHGRSASVATHGRSASDFTSTAHL